MFQTKLMPFAVLLCYFAPMAFAADGPALDAAKYPQDTPQKALASIVKALDGNDMAYWIAWLVTPADTKRLVEKYGSVADVVKANADEKRAAGLKKQLETMKKMLEENKGSESEEGGIKLFRFQSEARILQLEKQADGRWCMNPRVMK